MKIGIFGTGAYGMALASILSENKHDITMWTKFKEEKDLLIKDRGNQKLLPGFFLDNNIKITNNINECAKEKDLLVIAIPAAFVTDLCSELSYVVDKDVNICIASKGIEQNSGLFVHQIVGNYIDSENKNYGIKIENALPTLQYYGKYAYIKVPSQITESESIELIITVRNNQYKYKLK